MSRAPKSRWPEAADVDAAAIKAQLNCILESGEFHSSARMRDFLAFVVSETLAGSADTLKEYTIATQVFGRPPSFDPSIDPVVRVEARRLRAKLACYYSGAAGQGDDIIISLPKGRYVPHFSRASTRDRSRVAEEIGVACFKALGEAAESWCIGLQFELVDRLTRVHGVRVVVIDRSFPFSRCNGTPEVITGCIHVQGDHVRVVAHLIANGSGHCRWSAAVEFPLLHTAQQHVAGEISRLLVAQLAQHEM